MGVKAWATTNDTVWAAPSGAIITALVDDDNPLGIRPYTLRFEFGDSSYDPTTQSWKAGSYWTQVSSSPNVWDFTYVSASWGNIDASTQILYGKFQDHGNPVKVLGGNLVGVVEAVGLFSHNTAITEINTFDTSTIQNAERFFSGCTYIASAPRLDLSSVTSTYLMFGGCTNLISISQDLDFSNVRDASSTFSGCTSLTTLPTLNFKSARTLSNLFSNCESLVTAPVMLNTNNVTHFYSCFKECSSLTSVPDFDTSSGVYFEDMFQTCVSLQHAPTLNTRNGSDLSRMFSSCVNLQEVPLYDTANADNVEDMFYACRKVTSGALALYTQMTSQLLLPTKHDDCFYLCGANTVTGAAELAQIPTDWGGTMA